MNNEQINFFIKQIETLAKVVVATIKKHLFRVRVDNFPKTQEIKGTVIVGNQKKVEDGQKTIIARIDLGFKEIVAVLKQIVSKEYPKTIEVSNLKKPEKVVIPDRITIENFKEVTQSLESIKEEVKKLKLDPKIEVASPNVTVSPTPVTVNEQIIDVEKPIENLGRHLKSHLEDTVIALKGAGPTEAIPVRLSNGKEFYEAITNIVSRSRRSQPVTVVNGNILTNFEINDMEKAGDNIVYKGLEDKDGLWCIQKIDSSAGNVFRFATQTNNPNYNTYPSAWADRLSLVYGYFSESF